MNFISKIRTKYLVSAADTPYDKMCQEIVKDESLLDHIAHYVSGDPDALSQYPADTKKLESILKKGPWLKAGGVGMIPKYFYRGEALKRDFSEYGYETRLVESWSPNKEEALDFAKNVAGGVVRQATSPVQGVLISDLAYWSTLAGKNMYSGGISEWLLLRPKHVKTVYTKEDGWLQK